MFTRLVEVNSKSGKRNELINHVQEHVLPIIKRQTGLVDEILLTSDTEPDRVLALTFWKSKEDADRYHRENYAKINETMSAYTESAPTIRTFNVHSSSSHKIAAGKAA
jgi:quinol monooxygenase YgiN